MLRPINNTVRTLLIHAFMPPTYWVEALSTAILLINQLPSTTTPTSTPFKLLHNKEPTYQDLRVFGCLCYPNTSATTAHKLPPRSVPCVFLSYLSSHKGYRCINLVTQQLIISRHVTFDETMLPFHFRYPNGHDTMLDFLLPPASSPLLVQDASPDDTGHSPASTDDESLALVHHSMRRASTSTLATPPASGAQDSVHGSAHMPATAPPPTSSHRRGMVDPVPHPVAVTCAEGHTHTMFTRRAAGVTLKPADPLNLSTTTSPVISPVPTDYRSALSNPHWHAAMQDEF
jgi:hypothetical protein